MNLLDKPRLMEKLKAFYDYTKSNNGQIGTKQRGIDLNFNNACNLKCTYCFTNSPKGVHAKDELDLKKISEITGYVILNPKKSWNKDEIIKKHT